MSGFKSIGEDFDRVFIKDYEIVDQFVGERIWSCGYNSNGQLGTNNTTSYSSPVVTVDAGTNWKQAASTQNNTAAIKTDGTLWTWGNNNYGQLGDNTNITKSSPVTTAAGSTNWKQVAVGNQHAAAIKTDGTLWTWGNNNQGRLGDNTTAMKSSPVTTAAGDTNWKQVACGGLHTVAIKTDGTLWACGYNGMGQLGDNTTVNKSSPVTAAGGGTNWKQVGCGANHTAAIKTDGTLWTWGNNFNGQLGDNTTVTKSSPVTTAAGGTNWKQVACGQSYTTAVKTDGTLWIWGGNSNGVLGDNTIVDKSSPVTTISGGNDWKQVACGVSHTAGVKTDGTLWLWGFNAYGQLGVNNTTSTSSPVSVYGGSNWKQVACGVNHTIIIGD